MSPVREATEVLDRLSLLSPQQRVLRLGVGLAGAGFLVLVPLAGGVWHPVASALLGLLVLVAVVLPESHAALALVVSLGVLWGVSVPRGLDGWVLVAAADLWLLHVTCTLASYGPSGLVLDRAPLVAWARRTVVCLVAALAVWAAAVVLDVADLPGTGLVLGLALAVVLAWVGLLSRRLVRREPPAPRP